MESDTCNILTCPAKYSCYISVLMSPSNRVVSLCTLLSLGSTVSDSELVKVNDECTKMPAKIEEDDEGYGGKVLRGRKWQ